MVDGLGYAVIAGSLVMAGWSLLVVAQDRAVGRAVLVGLAGLEVIALVQLVVAAVLLIMGPRPEEMATFIGYLVASVLVVPLGTVWALEERSRPSTAVLAVACLVLPILVLRLGQVWGDTGA